MNPQNHGENQVFGRENTGGTRTVSHSERHSAKIPVSAAKSLRQTKCRHKRENHPCLFRRENFLAYCTYPLQPTNVYTWNVSLSLVDNAEPALNNPRFAAASIASPPLQQRQLCLVLLPRSVQVLRTKRTRSSNMETPPKRQGIGVLGMIRVEALVSFSINLNGPTSAPTGILPRVPFQHSTSYLLPGTRYEYALCSSVRARAKPGLWNRAPWRNYL